MLFFVRVREVYRHPDNFLTKYSADLQSAWNIILFIDNHALFGLLGPLLSPFSSCGVLTYFCPPNLSSSFLQFTLAVLCWDWVVHILKSKDSAYYVYITFLGSSTRHTIGA